MEPSELYKPVLRIVKEKNYLVKYVIEFLEKAVVPENHLDCEYEDLMNHLSLVVPPPDLPVIDDELLLKHADFVVHQVTQALIFLGVNLIKRLFSPRFTVMKMLVTTMTQNWSSCLL